MSSQAVVLLVVVPVAAAVLSSALGLRGRGGGWTIATAGLLGTVGLAVSVAVTAVRSGPLSYAVGGYEPPYGIELVVDGLSVVMVLTTAAVALGAVLYGRGERRSNHFHAVYLLLVAGIFGLSLTGDLFTMYVFFEITGLAAYTLVATGKGGGATYAAFKYLVVGTVGASFFLFGVGYLYIVTGALNMADVAMRLGEAGYDSPAVLAAAAFLLVGLAVKIPLVPVHSWLPDAHSRAPPGVSAVISALVTAASAYALARVLFGVFTVRFVEATPVLPVALATLASASVLVGTTVAIRQRSVKRMLAYSSVSQFGLVVLGVAMVNATALTGSLVHIAGHAVMKAGLFLAAGAVLHRFDASTVDEYAGLGRRAPVLATSFVVLALAMVGIPPGVGFFGKWYIALGAVRAEAWPVAAVVFASTMLTLAYFLQLFERMYLGKLPVADGAGDGHHSGAGVGDHSGARDGHDPPTGERDHWRLAVVVTAAFGAVALGLLSNHLADFLAPTVEVVLT